MTLAQVVYNISTDNEFAKMWNSDPEAALAKRGLKLSREEMAFLSRGLQRKNSAQSPLVLNSGNTTAGLSWYQAKGDVTAGLSWYQAKGDVTDGLSWYQ